MLVELVLAGRHRVGADRLLSRYAGPAAATFVTAAHGLIEATSAVRRLMREDLLTSDRAQLAIEWLGALDLVLDATAPRLARVWSLRDRMSACDAAYAAAAEALACPLVSVDARLLRACAGVSIPAVHLDDLDAAG